MRRPHESPQCECEACKLYDANALRAYLDHVYGPAIDAAISRVLPVIVLQEHVPVTVEKR